MNMNDAIKKLLAAILADYTEYQDRSNVDDKTRQIQLKMRDEFESSLSFKEGKKYIKIIKGGSVWGFVVNSDDAKFRYGDILKPASWSTPAKNSARGNVFEDYEVQWTGPLYLR